MIFALRAPTVKYCTPQRYKIVQKNAAYKQVPTWVWNGFTMINTGEQTQKWEYIKFICGEYDSK
jgi:hypothetical protein